MRPRIDHLDITVKDLDREEVDRVYAQVKDLPGVTIVSPPKLWAEYTPDYYAFFFKDPDGIKLEVVHFDRRGWFGGSV